MNGLKHGRDKKETDMLRMKSSRIFGALGAAAALVAVQLAAAPVVHADDDSDATCYTTRSTTDPFYQGPSASRVYDWVNTGAQTNQRFSKSVPIPAGLLSARYVPQGLTHWANWNGTGEDLLLIAAYEDTNGDSVPDGPSGLWGVVASGSRTGTSLGRMLIAEGHVGGVAIYGGWLYVGSEEEIRGYRLGKLRDALVGANTNAVYARDYNRASSYRVGFMGTGDGHLWAGAFSETASTHLNGYVQTSAAQGTLAYQAGTQSYAPKKTQGVTVTAGHAIFSTSYGRNDRGNIWVMPRNAQSLSDENSYCFRAPSMNQGVTVLNGRLYLGFESGAYTYNRTLDDPDNPITTVHSATLSEITSLYSGGPAD